MRAVRSINTSLGYKRTTTATVAARDLLPPLLKRKEGEGRKGGKEGRGSKEGRTGGRKRKEERKEGRGRKDGRTEGRRKITLQ